MSTKPEVELIFTIVLVGNGLYFKNGKRYDVGLKGSQIGNEPWAFD